MTFAPLTPADDGRRESGNGALLPSAPRRPGQKFERLEVALHTRRALAIAAADARVPLDVAATLLCEAGLLLDRLDARRVAHARDLLDRAASSSRVRQALTTANADYLRALSCRSWRRDRGEIDLPARLLPRIGSKMDAYLGRGELLESAIRWEIGAVLADRSMCSWGTEVVLGGFQSFRRAS